MWEGVGEGCDDDAVVGDRGVLDFGLGYAVHHIATVEHTGSAMYHKVILR